MIGRNTPGTIEAFSH
ncbi:hypothetical protein YPPY15_2976, partial [Yersinia pestis PY-15]